MIKRKKTKQTLMGTILELLKRYGGLTCFELIYLMKSCKRGTTTNYNKRRVTRYLLLLRNLDKVEFDRTTKIWSIRVVQTTVREKHEELLERFDKARASSVG